MKLTNRQNLPQAIYDAVKADPYTKGDADASVTELIGPPRLAALKREHASEIVEDAADRIYSLLGQSIHTILERANRTGISERRFFMPVGGWTISGAFDAYYADGLLQDYKLTSAWSVKGGVKPEWEAQLNLGRLLIEHEEPTLKITKLQAVAILRDWSKLEARRDPEYPQSQVVVIDVPLWDREKAMRYLNDRVTLHQQARVTLPQCSQEERWAKPAKYALMKVGGKRAVKLYDTEAEARAHASVDPKNLRVEVRPGESTRCEAYCSVAQFCTQYQQEKAANQPQAEKEKVAV